MGLIKSLRDKLKERQRQRLSAKTLDKSARIEEMKKDLELKKKLASVEAEEQRIKAELKTPSNLGKNLKSAAELLKKTQSRLRENSAKSSIGTGGSGGVFGTQPKVESPKPVTPTTRVVVQVKEQVPKPRVTKKPSKSVFER